MDGLSIATGALALAKVAWSCGKELNSFIKNTRTVSEHVKRLEEEVKHLCNICNSVGEQIQVLQASGNNDLPLLKGIDDQVKACTGVIRRLDKALNSVREDKSNVFSQAVRQTKLELKDEEIEECRKQMHINITNLQISLQLLNLKATYLAPRLANEALLTRLEDLQNAINSQSQKLDETLLQCADQYLSEGGSLYAESIAARSVDGLLPETKQTAISDWISKLRALRLDAAAAQTSLPTSHTGHTSFSVSSMLTPPLAPADGSATSIDSTFTPPEAVSSESHDMRREAEHDEEDELALELVQAALDTGKTAYVHEDHTQAEDMLREALTLIQALPERQRRKYDLEEIHYFLAMTSIHVHEASTAEAALMSLVERQSISDEDALRKCSAGVQLALLYVSLSRLEPARLTAESAYRSYRKLVDKDDIRCLQALALLAHIHDLSGAPSRAKTYRALLPAGTADRYAELNTMALNKLQDLSRMSSAQTTTNGFLPKSGTPLRTRDGGALIATQSEQSKRIRCLAISKDGSLLACGLSDDSYGWLELRDTVSATCLVELFGPLRRAKPDTVVMASRSFGAILASSFPATTESDPQDRLWARAGPHIAIWKRMNDEPQCMEISDNSTVEFLSFSPQGTLLASLHSGKLNRGFWKGGTVSYRDFRLWNVDTGKEIHHQKSNREPLLVDRLVFSRDGSLLAVMEDSRVSVLQIGSMTTIARHSSGGLYRQPAAWGDNNILAVVDGNSSIQCYAEGKDYLFTEDSSVMSEKLLSWTLLGFMPSGKLLFITFDRRRMFAWHDGRVYDLRSIFEREDLPGDMDYARLSPDRTMLTIVHSKRKKYSVWDLTRMLDLLQSHVPEGRR